MVAERYITVFLQGDYYIHKYKNIFAAYIHPIIEKFNGTNYKCVTFQDMTEAEYKLPSEKDAKECAKLINKMFKTLPESVIQQKSIASVMPSYYEDNGFRNIVRPDYHMGNIKIKPIPGFAKLKLAKKYINRNSPPLPANDYCNVTMIGNDGTKYISNMGTTYICKWIRI